MNQSLLKQTDEFWGVSDAVEVLTFNIAGETFAIEAVKVREILDLLPETAVPGAKAFVASVINFRGRSSLWLISVLHSAWKPPSEPLIAVSSS